VLTEGGRVTQVGEGREAAEAVPSVMTLGEPAVGDVMADRYQLEEHVNDDSAGRQIWRGTDVILRRPVAVVLRYPGGDDAAEMLQSAVAASRVIHPHLAGVYDAIDEGDRAYVVREWIDGVALRDLVSESGPMDAARAIGIARGVADAVAAVHATGMVHGNVHAGTTMIGTDGRVVLADARTDGDDKPGTDVRAVGGVLYFALTGHWPHAEAGVTRVQDAVRDGSGSIVAPRQARAGVPAYLDDLTMDLLDPKLAVPASDVLAAELTRLDSAAEEQYLEEVGPLRFTQSGDEQSPDQPQTAARKIAVGVAALLAIAVIGLMLGISALGGDPENRPAVEAGTDQGDAAAPGAIPNPQPFKLTKDQIRVVDPGPNGDGGDRRNAELAIDGDDGTSWETQTYNTRKFGELKDGLGLLIDLGSPRQVSSVKIQLGDKGVSAELKTGETDPGAAKRGAANDELKPLDRDLVNSYGTIGAGFKNSEASTMAFIDGLDPDAKYQYLLVWFTELPDSRKIVVDEIIVEGT
jgi:eukaryotic-like serine/threonine-protein kinase